MSPTFVLIPGAGGSAWYWHPVTPLLSATGANVVAVGLPAADDSADLSTYADVVCAGPADLDGPVVLVAQSMGAFTAPVAVDRLATRNPGSSPERHRVGQPDGAGGGRDAGAVVGGHRPA